MDVTEARPHRIRTSPIQLFFLVMAVVFGALNPVPIQLLISGVMLALVGIATTITTFRKEAEPPEVFFGDQHFQGGGSIPLRTGKPSPRSSIGQQVYLRAHPILRLLVLSPSTETLQFSLGYGRRRFFGPWILPKEDVARVERVPAWFLPHDPIRITSKAGLTWSFLTGETGTVLKCLEELGYPISRDGY